MPRDGARRGKAHDRLASVGSARLGGMANSWASTDAVRRSMRSNRRRDSRPELAIRRAVWARGLRYRVDGRPVASVNRRADLVFSRVRVAVFVDGCFWHRCPEHGTLPSTNAEFWMRKLERNAARDRETDLLLQQQGWRVLRFWEHEDPAVAADVIEWVVRSDRQVGN